MTCTFFGLISLLYLFFAKEDLFQDPAHLIDVIMGMVQFFVGHFSEGGVK